MYSKENKMKRTKIKDRKLPDYTKGEEIFNMVSHIVGGGIGVTETVLCVVFALTTITGMLFILGNNASPESPGSIRSSKIKSGTEDLSTKRASAPEYALDTQYPFFLKASSTILPI